MLTLHSILRRICQFFRGLAVKATKKMYRSSAVFMAGAAVITVVAFTAAGFGGSGKNAITAFAETPPDMALEEDAALEEESVTEAKVQVQSDELQQQGKLLAGNLLEKGVQKRQTVEQSAKAELERIQTQIVMEANKRAEEAEAEAQKLAEEEAAKKAEEEEKTQAVSVSAEDYQVLLKIVQAEAGICDDKGKILVANVILNRVKSSEFPNTVRGVVYERSQFSPVSNGSINTVKVTSATRESVDRALAGEDYSQGALYFMYRKGSRSRAVSWFDSHLTYLFRHENHEFFK